MKKSKSKKCQNGGMATGVVVSKKDEKANPKDFTYLKKSEKAPVVAKKVTIKTKK